MKNKEWEDYFDAFSLDTRERMPNGHPSMILVWYGGTAGVQFSRESAKKIRDDISEWLSETEPGISDLLKGKHTT